MNKYRYKGSAERVFPYARPPIVVSPGDVVEHPENLDESHWFELVPSEPVLHPNPLAALEAAQAEDKKEKR